MFSPRAHMAPLQLSVTPLRHSEFILGRCVQDGSARVFVSFFLTLQLCQQRLLKVHLPPAQRGVDVPALHSHMPAFGRGWLNACMCPGCSPGPVQATSHLLLAGCPLCLLNDALPSKALLPRPP